MPLKLLHGPAGAGKTSFLLRHISETHRANDPGDRYFIIVPTPRSVETYQKKLIEELSSSIFIGDSILPFDQFLLRLLKLNLPRVHFATASLSRNVVRKLLYEKKYPSFEQGKNFSGIVSELTSTIIRLKENGLSPNSTQSFFQKYKSDIIRDLITLFSDYQRALQEIYYFDAGDLYAETLSLLRKNELKLPKGLKAIYIDRIFPLSLGQREFIKELNRKFPDLETTVSFSFDYQSEDEPYLYPAYSFLGELAQENEYFHLTNLESQAIHYSFCDPATETRWIVSSIRKQLNNGIAPHQIGILLPSYSFYHQKFSELLKNENIALTPPYSPSLKNFSYLKPKQIDSLITEYLEKPLDSLFEASSALAQIEDFEKKVGF